MTEIAHFIDNARVPGASGRSQPVWNPATGESDKTVALASAEEVGRAVAAAAAAWPAWARTPALRRARILDRFKMILWDRMDRLAEAISAEHGKTHDDAVGEVTRGLEVVEFAVGAPNLLKGEFTENVGTGVDSHALRQPLGRGGRASRPFNFPAMVPMWMFPVALAVGNTFVLKPSERDPSASLHDRRVARRGRPAQGRVQRRAGRQGGRGRAADASRRQGSELRRLDAHREVHPRDGHPPRQARAGTGRGQEPHGDPARRRPRHGGQRADGRGLRLRGRALHGHLGRGSGDRPRRRRADRAARAQDRGAQGGSRRRPVLRDGPRGDPGRQGADPRLHRQAASRRAPRSSSTAAASGRRRATRGATSSVPR